MKLKKPLEEIGTYKRNIKVDLRTWDSLNRLKGRNETFNDVIRELLGKKTVAVGNKNVKAIKYSRKVMFIKINFEMFLGGLEFEYNDVKEQQSDFTLDLKIKKVFYGKRVLNPSEFFGIDSQHKHFSQLYLKLYLKCVTFALEKEFKVNPHNIINSGFEDITIWRSVYYDYNLSEESFKEDIEEPLRLSEQEKPTEKYKKNIKESIAYSIGWE